MAATAIQPYLFFGGRCDEAISYYREALGAEVIILMRFKDSPEPHPPGMLPEGFEDKVMHATLRIGNAMILMSDGRCMEETKFDGFSLSISVESEAEADRVFGAISSGGKVHMPMAKTFWSPRFGMAQDRFGVGWMISVAV